MAESFKLAIESAEFFNDAGADIIRDNASATSPLTSFLNEN
jgi:thiazole synthase ThiGH ThiG subunit